MVTKIEAVIRPHLLGKVKDALIKEGIRNFTFTYVMGIGKNRGRLGLIFRGNEYFSTSVAMIKVEVVVPDDVSDLAIDTIFKASRTWKIGDGKIFIQKVDEAVRILNGACGNYALIDEFD